ncbi:Ras-related protein [Venturia nashicola]|uniref:Ras-related protein n=1 Tax=Venturia nashicola TaxID=86259 RepID=A0A4Z1NVN4_9PEZI|nr:Ras-related protein [Venturia nashicola]TLD31971.1 Ras-related protein [Venturia nashicola]
MPSSTPKPSKAIPASFLTLPRELRQRILLHVYELPNRFNYRLHHAVTYTDTSIRFERGRMTHWVRMLMKVNSFVADDMEFVERQWNRELDDARAFLG